MFMARTPVGWLAAVFLVIFVEVGCAQDVNGFVQKPSGAKGHPAPALEPQAPITGSRMESEAVSFTLSEAVRHVLEHSPETAIARLQTASSIQGQAMTRSALFPQVSITGSFQETQFNMQSITGGDWPSRIGPFQTMQMGPAFTQKVVDFAAIRRLRVARQNTVIANKEEILVREQLSYAVVHQFLLCWRSLASVKATRSRVQLAETLYTQASNLLKSGIGTRVDTLRAEVQLQNERQRLIEVETDARTSVNILAQILDLPANQELSVKDSWLDMKSPEISQQAAWERALVHRPEFQIQRAREEEVRLKQDLAGAAELPVLSVSGFAAQQGGIFPGTIPAFSLQVNLSVPVFTGGRIPAEDRAAGLETARVAQEGRALESRIWQEVKTALDQLTAARQAIGVAQQGVRLAQEEITQASHRFQAGVTNNIEVISAQDALARANENEINAQYRFNQACADVARAMGDVENNFSQ